MLTPDMRQHPPDGQPWAADNGCYANPARYTDARYLAWLERWAPARDRCLFATAPDVWGDAAATLERSLPMLATLAEAGYPPALCAQDGLTPELVPWPLISALFVGGSDTWRHSAALEALALAAAARGVWLHVGRVNSWKRYEWARALGADSVDGTVLRFDPARPVASWPARAATSPMLWRR